MLPLRDEPKIQARRSGASSNEKATAGAVESIVGPRPGTGRRLHTQLPRREAPLAAAQALQILAG